MCMNEVQARIVVRHIVDQGFTPQLMRFINNVVIEAVEVREKEINFRNAIGIQTCYPVKQFNLNEVLEPLVNNLVNAIKKI